MSPGLTTAGRWRDGETRLDIIDEGGGEDEAGYAVDAEGSLVAPTVEELLHYDGEDYTGEASSSLHFKSV